MTVMRSLVLAVIAAFAVPALACDFKYDPVSMVQYYRAEGWSLPGIEDSPLAPVGTYGLPGAPPIPGFEARVVRHEIPNIVTFPAQEFGLNGARQRMRAMQVKANILPWVTSGRTVAYSYGLIPVNAHRKKGKWVIDVEAGCIFDATFIDDKGDGVFRIQVPGPFTADLVPAWAMAKTD
jgi:hypothetical protein